MTTVTLPYSPREQFLPFHERTQRFASLVCHRRAGKTVAAVNDLIRGAALCDKPNPRFAYIAPFYKQAKDIAWTYLRQGVAPLIEYGASIHESELRVDLPNRGRVRLYGADNPDSLRGIYLDGVVLDEPAQIDPTLWPEILRPALADRMGWGVFVGTPKGRNAFYEIWRSAQKSGDWYTLLLRASETGLLPEGELAAAREAMTDAQYRQEFECSFHEPDVSQFITNEEVDRALGRFESAGAEDRPRVFGLDVARFGDDRTVLLIRHGHRVHEIYAWRGLDTMQTAMHVAAKATEHQPDAIFVDGAGVGGGVVDRMREMAWKVVDVQAGSRALDDKRYANKRAEMWGVMREWLRERGALPNETELVDDLLSPLYKFDAQSRILLEKKDDMKARGLPSPDFGDALAMTFAAPVPHADIARMAVQFQKPHATGSRLASMRRRFAR